MCGLQHPGRSHLMAATCALERERLACSLGPLYACVVRTSWSVGGLRGSSEVEARESTPPLFR